MTLRALSFVLALAVCGLWVGCDRPKHEFDTPSWVGARHDQPTRVHMMPAVKEFLDTHPHRGDVRAKLGAAPISEFPVDYWWVLIRAKAESGDKNALDGLRVNYDKDGKVVGYAYPVRYPVERSLGTLFGQ